MLGTYGVMAFGFWHSILEFALGIPVADLASRTRAVAAAAQPRGSMGAWAWPGHALAGGRFAESRCAGGTRRGRIRASFLTRWVT